VLGKDAVTGHPGKALKDVGEQIAQTVKHPVKSFEQHPVNSILIWKGVKGGVGHTAGTAMRKGALGDVGRRAASTARDPKEVPGARVKIHRRYSGDPSTKLGQVVHERHKVRVAAKKGKPSPRLATQGDIHHRVDEDVQAAKIVTGHHQSQVGHDAAQAIGYADRGPIKRVKRRAKGGKTPPKPTAATNLTAQGITDATEADLRTYLRELKGREPKLKKSRELNANRATQRLIEKALQSHDEVAVQRAARAFQAVSASVERDALARGLVDPQAAEAARLAGVKARRVTRSSSPATRVVRKAANKVLKRARIEAGRADAAYRSAVAEARAARTSSGGIPPVQHDALLKAIDRRDRANTALADAVNKAHAANVAHTSAHLQPGEQPAFVSHQPIEPRSAAIPVDRPRIPVSKERKGPAITRGTLDAHPAKLVEQVQGTQRLIDAVDAREGFLHEWGWRGKDTSKPVRTFGSKNGAEGFAQDRLEKRTGLQWAAMKRQDGKYVLVPKDALKQLKRHQDKVKIQHPLVRAAGAQWRRNVLAFSPRWFFGNQIEGAVRSVVAGAGPASYITAKRALKELKPAEREQAMARTVGGGQYRVSNRIASERNIPRDAQNLGNLAHAVQRLGQTRTAGALSDVYGAYTDIVFRSVNGRLENQFQIAMLGKALRRHPLMEERIVGLSRRAVQDAANGLRDSNNLVELGRAVDDMYGRYGKFSPGLQEMIANYTPFIAWTLNATNFLFHVLPRDHPVLTGLLASANVATEKWRKQHGLYLDVFGTTKGQLPPWLMGGIPGAAGSNLRLARYTPFGILDADGAPVLGSA
jgi:hypothetical protein